MLKSYFWIPKKPDTPNQTIPSNPLAIDCCVYSRATDGVEDNLSQIRRGGGHCCQIEDSSAKKLQSAVARKNNTTTSFLGAMNYVKSFLPYYLEIADCFGRICGKALQGPGNSDCQLSIPELCQFPSSFTTFKQLFSLNFDFYICIELPIDIM